MKYIEEKKKLLTPKYNLGYVNELTKYLDSCIDRYGGFYNYLYEEKIDGYYILRYPGCSTGRILVDEDNKIVSIEMYESTLHHYNNGIESHKLKEFIGCEIDMDCNVFNVCKKCNCVEWQGSKDGLICKKCEYPYYSDHKDVVVLTNKEIGEELEIVDGIKIFKGFTNTITI